MYVTNCSKGHEELSTLSGALPAVRYSSTSDDAVNDIALSEGSSVTSASTYNTVRSQVLTAVTMNVTVLWDVPPYRKLPIFRRKLLPVSSGWKNKIFLLRGMQKMSMALQRRTPTHIRKLLL